MNPIITGSYTIIPAQATNTIIVNDYTLPNGTLNPGASAVASFILTTNRIADSYGIAIFLTGTFSEVFLIGSQVNRGATAADTIVNFAAAINANTNVNSYVVATPDTVNTSKCNLIAQTAGVDGNSIGLSTNNFDGRITISGANFTGGIDESTSVTINVHGVDLSSEADWIAETSNAVTATNIKNAINTSTATTGVRATSIDNIVTLIVNDVGVVGDLYTLTSNDVIDLLLGGSTFSGGSRGDAGTLGVAKSVTGLFVTTHATVVYERL